MKDDELKPLTPDLEALLDAERGAPPAPSAARERVRGRLAGAIGIAALGAGTAHAAGATPAVGTSALEAAQKLAGKSLAAKLALAVVGVTGAVGLGVGVHALLRRSAPSVAPIASPAAPAPPANAPLANAPAPAAPAPAPSLPAPAAPAHAVAPPHHIVHTGGDLIAERRLLDAGRAALARGDHAAALAALARHRREFPHGQLAEERDSLWIGALAAAGRSDEARARAARFRAQHPRSIFLPAVEATLKSLR